MFLNRDEIFDLTQKRQRRLQQAVLNGMGIPFIVRPNGSLAVMRAVVEKAFGLTKGPVPDKRLEDEPDLDAFLHREPGSRKRKGGV